MSARARILERFSQFDLLSMTPEELQRLIEVESRRLDVAPDYVQLLVDAELCRGRSDADTTRDRIIQRGEG